MEPKRRGRAGLRTVFHLTWIALLSSGCTLTQRERWGEAAAATQSELLAEVREISREEGLVAGRAFLEREFARIDQSGGTFERRVIATTQFAGLVYPDSLASLPRSTRKRIAIVIVPGTQIGFGPPSQTRLTLAEAADEADEMGFSTHFIDTPPRGGVSENAIEVAAAVKPVFRKVDHVLLISLSKGAHDLIYYLQHQAQELPLADRQKIRAVLSLVGTVQGSVMADYFGNAPRAVAAVTRATLHLKGGAEEVAMLRTVAATPWFPDCTDRMKRAFPNLTWVSIVALPDGDDGTISAKFWSPPIRRIIRNQSPYFSPADGLVESGGAVLPEEVDFPEWVLYSYGSHSLPNGHYRDGTSVAPETRDPDCELLNPESGGEMMSAYLRALPTSLLWQ
ncbi:MAG: hypothetical protein AAGA96_12665 [Verrucomicrobiota bacterium]